MTNKLNYDDLKNVNGGLKYDGRFYSLSCGDCFVDPSGHLRYIVTEDYIEIEEGTAISIKCLEMPYITSMNFSILMGCTYVGNGVFK